MGNFRGRVELEWRGVAGYRCPECFLYVTFAQSLNPRYCPRCVKPLTPLNERIYAVLREAGFDETDSENATNAVMGLVDD